MAEPRETKIRHEELDVPYNNTAGAGVSSDTVLINRVSWGAIFAGVTVLLVTQLFLNMIGIGIGTATINPTEGDAPTFTGFSIGAAIWWTISSIIAAFAGGFAASRMAGQPKTSTGAWHGLTAWAVSMLIVFYLLVMAAGTAYNAAATTVGGAFGMLGGTAQTFAQLAAPAMEGEGDPFSQIAEGITGGADEETTQASIDAAVAALRAVVTGGQANQEQARADAARALSEAQDIPLSEARQRVDQYANQYQQAMETARAQATEVADRAASAISRASLLGAFAMFLAALAAWFGGRMGTVDPTVLRAYYMRQDQRAGKTTAH